MIDYIMQLLGMDLEYYQVSDEVLFSVSALIVVFTFGELFNIIRSIFDRR